ncbi:hypothetical protein [Actinomadura craniellae]|uniref:hypothetical protein n=1 Tax=Actinomadura craniellae TaxID=2231787 RepID=UPI0011BE115F|nr:hypothetical protein [Actinomadura craniellae]
MTEAEIHAEQAALRKRYGTPWIWYGWRTGRWWALAGGRLVEAVSPGELGRAMRTSASWPWPPVR